MSSNSLELGKMPVTLTAWNSKETLVGFRDLLKAAELMREGPGPIIRSELSFWVESPGNKPNWVA